ncbi:YgjP-like metallopeptidase domain-containing protein [Candidatus Electrothrix aarhusensis]
MKAVHQVHQHSRHSVLYGQKTIAFSLLYCERKTMEIAVHPDNTVVVKAPVQSDIALIEKKIRQRARWILKQLNYFKQFVPKTPARCYVNGETHLYLGKQYRLKLVKGSENSVKLSRGFFHVTSRDELTSETARRLLHQWYLEKARLQFAASMERCWQKIGRLGIDTMNKPMLAVPSTPPRLSIKRMHKRWGSLSGKGTVTLNTDLIRAPQACIDYVVTHELCHLQYHDHSPEFYRLLDAVMPGWKKIKHKLELSMV